MAIIKNIKYDVEPSKDGFPTLSVFDAEGEKVYLHSRYSPLKEAESLRDKFNPDKYDMIIILGAGLGYHLLPLKETYHKYKKIIIIDIIDNIDNEIEKNPATGFLAGRKNISFITGFSPAEIEGRLSAEIDLGSIRGISVIEHPASLRVFPEYYTTISRLIRKVLNKKGGDSATIRAFGYLYLKNIFRNLESAAGHFPVSSFFGKMTGYPAVVVTTGPSIENQLEIIKRSQDRFFIIAVDSNVSLLTKRGIRPDFFISIDPQPFIYEHVLGADLTDIIPIYSLSAHPHMFRGKPGLVSLNSHPVCQLIEKISDNAVGSIDSLTGTVSGDAISACGLFGFKKTALAGFDFSFMDYKIYPRGTAYQKRYANSSTRLSTVESANMNYIMRSSRGVKFQGRFSRQSFIRYKEAIEDFISREEEPDIININSSGIALQGTKNLATEDFVGTCCGEKLDKKGILYKTLSSTGTIESILNNSRFNDVISDREIFDEILKTSVDAELPSAKIETLKTLLSRI